MPELVDVVDRWTPLQRKAATRNKVYAKFGFRVEHVSASDMRRAMNRRRFEQAAADAAGSTACRNAHGKANSKANSKANGSPSAPSLVDVLAFV